MRSGQIIQFPLSKGLTEDSNQKAAPVSTLKTGQNIRWARDGVIGKRYGVKLKGNLNTSPHDAKRIISRDKELAVICKPSNSTALLRTYNGTANKWVDSQRVSELSLEWYTCLDSTEGIIAADSQILSDGTIVDVWVTGDPASPRNTGSTATCSIYFQLRDSETGAILVAPFWLSQACMPQFRLLVSGTYYVIFWADKLGNLVASTGDGLTIGPDTTLKTNVTTVVEKFAIDALVVGSNAVVCYTGNGSTGLRVFNCTLAETPAVGTTSISFASADVGSISMARSGSNLWVTYADITNHKVRFFIIDSSALTGLVSVADVSTVAANATVAATIQTISGTDYCLLVYSFSNSTYSSYQMCVKRITSAGSQSSGQAVPWMRVLTRPFLIGTKLYVLATTEIFRSGYDKDAISNADTVLLDVTYTSSGDTDTPLYCAGKLDVFVGGTFVDGFVSNACTHSSTKTYIVAPFQSTPAPGLDAWRQGVRYVTISSGAGLIPDMYRAVQLERESYFVAGMLSAYDGADALSYGWPVPARIDAQRMTVDANGSMTAGDYIYNATAERRSAVGIMHRAPMGIPFTVNVPSANGRVNVAIATASMGRSANIPGMYPIYRSVQDGSTLYRLTIEPTFMSKKDTESGWTVPVTIYDTSSDSSIGIQATGLTGSISLSERPQPYTASGELEDCSPPAPYFLHYHNGRLGIITGGRREYWFSKDVRENPGIAPGFNPAQVELYDQDLVACATLDDKRIMFAKRTIWYVTGDGPNVQGLDNRFSAPVAIQTDVGCTNPRSVVSWPGGVMFQNGTDIFNVGRGLEVTWIGKDVRNTIAAYPDIKSAVLVSDHNEIRFSCTNSAGTASILVVFDYERKVWFTREYSTAGIGVIYDAAMHDGVYYLATDEGVFYEDTSVFYDQANNGEGGFDNVYVPSTVELEPIAPAGPEGWQRVRVAKMLGRALSNHSLTISASRDWATSYEQSVSFANGSAVTTPDEHMRAEVALTVQRRQAVGLKFVDATPANTTAYPLGNGAGFELEGVALLVQPKQGLPRDTSSRRGG